MDKNEKMLEMENGDIVRLLLKFGVPTMIGMLITAFYNLVDAYFVGYLGTKQMAAVSLIYPLGLFITGIGILFGSGTGANIARALGKKDYNLVSRYTSTAIITGSLVGIVVVLMMLIWIDPLLQILGANADTYGYAKSFGTIIIIGFLFSVYNIVCNNIIISEGSGRFSMSALILGGVLNMVLDPVFVFVLHFGVEGVAYATLISSMISTALYTSYIFNKKSLLNFSIMRFTPSYEIFSNILKIGIPILVFQILMCLSLSLTNMVAIKYGNEIVASLGIVNRVLSLEMMAVFGFLKGYQALVGYNYGANKEERVYALTKKASLMSTGFCVLFNVICVLFAKNIILSFNKESAEVLSFGMTVLRVLSLTYMTLGFQLVYSSYFLATGKAKEGGILSITRQGLIFIPILFLLNSFFGKTGLILAQPVSDIIACIVTWFICQKSNVFGHKIITQQDNLLLESANK